MRYPLSFISSIIPLVITSKLSISKSLNFKEELQFKTNGFGNIWICPHPFLDLVLTHGILIVFTSAFDPTGFEARLENKTTPGGFKVISFHHTASNLRMITMASKLITERVVCSFINVFKPLHLFRKSLFGLFCRWRWRQTANPWWRVDLCRKVHNHCLWSCTCWCWRMNVDRPVAEISEKISFLKCCKVAAVNVNRRIGAPPILLTMAEPTLLAFPSKSMFAHSNE